MEFLWTWKRIYRERERGYGFDFGDDLHDARADGLDILDENAFQAKRDK
jgi:hypothetical protein